MNKEESHLEDGRRLIYYTFEDEPDDSAGESGTEATGEECGK